MKEKKKIKIILYLLAAKTKIFFILILFCLHEQMKFKYRSISPSFTTITMMSSPALTPFSNNFLSNWDSIPVGPEVMK